MSDLSARVVAALHEVRQKTPRECDNWCRSIYATGAALHSDACWGRLAASVDARTATCVEAYRFAGMWCGATHGHGFNDKAGLAAFLAAAAQERTT